MRNYLKKKLNDGKVSGEKLHQYNQFTAKYHGYVILCVVITSDGKHALQASPSSIPVSKRL